MSAELFGINVDTYTFEEALVKAKALLDGNSVSQVVTINPEMFAYAEKNTEFANIIKNAEMVIPDGVGVKIALKINGTETPRIPGVDFAKRLLIESATNSIPVAIIGAKEEIVTKSIQNLQNEISGLNIVYYHNGYFENNEDIYKEINAKSPKLILVATGSPKQEIFIYNAKKVLKPALMIGIGGSLDVWSGNVKRAPKLFQKLGLEWFYRTVTQPSRLKRIFPTLPMFIFKAFNYKFSK